mmetsp:Transcript_41923/g.30776  ORF Transcript_41923/g.30776 Transcript_41923/m.30776 type:complete len:94 (+) Transcript_41923:37-318(+)
MCCPDHAIAKTDQTVALICLILNIFWPGLGTIINAIYHEQPCEGIVYGILQMLTCIFIVGWIWSIVYGCKILDKSRISDHYVQIVEVHHYHDQ